jgi:hypothetical protein
MAQEDVPDAGGRPGIEHGTYVWDRASFLLTSSRSPAPYTDTNGTWGLSDPGGPVTVRISADGTTITATLLTEMQSVPRVGATYVPEPVLPDVVVEYHHAAFHHYFATSYAAEIGKLDAGEFFGWARSGETFRVYPLGAADTRNVCHFLSEAFAPRSSHFYTPHGFECDARRNDPRWSFEGEVFGFRLPDLSANRPAGTVPLFHFYHNGAVGAPNHRLTNSAPVRAHMLADGWQPEGIAAPQFVYAGVLP